MSNNQNRDFKGVWIPKEIWLNPNLSMVDKGVLTEIHSLDNEFHCVASNEYLAKFCGVSESTITRSIKKLKDLGYIVEVSNDGRTRVLKVTTLGSQIDYSPSPKCSSNNIDNNTTNKESNFINEITTAGAVAQDSSSETTTENYNDDCSSKGYSREELRDEFLGSVKKTKTTRRNMRRPTLFDKCVAEIDKFTDLPELREKLIQFLKIRLEVKDKPFGIESWKGMLNKLDQAVEECKREYVDVVQQSIDKGWLSFYPIDNKPKQGRNGDDNFSEGHGKVQSNKVKKGEDLSGQTF